VESDWNLKVLLQILISDEINHAPVQGQFLKILFVLRQTEVVFQPEESVGGGPVLVLLAGEESFKLREAVFHLN
jgi:hypothetical protein